MSLFLYALSPLFLCIKTNVKQSKGTLLCPLLVLIMINMYGCGRTTCTHAQHCPRPGSSSYFLERSPNVTTLAILPTRCSSAHGPAPGMRNDHCYWSRIAPLRPSNQTNKRSGPPNWHGGRHPAEAVPMVSWWRVSAVYLRLKAQLG